LPATASKSLSSQDDPRLVRALEEYLASLEAGAAPDKGAFLARHPDIAGPLAQCLDGLDFIRTAGCQARAPLPVPSLPTSAHPADIQPEAPLGDYRLVREIGRGGMGVVYEAVQMSLGRRVALKVLPFASTLDAKQLQRFKNEAQAAAHLHHQNIVPVYATGTERGVHFYAMQFIEGQTLASLISELRRQAGLEIPEGQAPTGPAEEAVREFVSGRWAPSAVHLPTAGPYQASPAAETATPPAAALSTERSLRGAPFYRTVATLAVQAAEALEHAHQMGVVHRDIKPANLLVDPRGNLWITDFGLAHCQSQAGLTMTGDLVGTLRYMSPEQALAKRVNIDQRTDIYSLGVTLYELLTLEPAYAGSDRQELLRQIAFEEPKRPRKINKSVPVELETIVLKAVEKNPADRYATAQELADDLRRFLEDRPIRARRLTLLQIMRKWARRHQAVVSTASAAGAVLLAVLAGSIGWVARDAAARRAQTERLVTSALEESASWQEQRRLLETLSAARRAEGLLAGADVDQALRQRVRARLADLKLLDRLENIRIEQLTAVKDGNFDLQGADALYGQTFRDAGLDVEALPPNEVGQRIAASTVAAELAAVLDQWASARVGNRGVDDSSWKDLLRIARLADPDVWRTRLREALERLDGQALRSLASSEEVFDLAPATLFLLGDAFQAAEQTRTQVEVFLRKAQRRHPNDFWLNINLWQHFAYMQPPQTEETLRFATVAAALRPDSPGAHLNLANALNAKGQLDEPIAEYGEAIRVKKDYAEAHCNLGNAVREKGLLDEAIGEYSEAIHIKKDYAEAHNNLGIALYNKGKFDEAITEIREAIRIKDDYAEAHHNLGVALADKGQFDEAIAEQLKALRIKDDYAEAHNSLGVALAGKGQFDEAIAEHHQAIRIKEHFAEAHNSLGVALAGKRQSDEAISEYRKAIRIKKDFADAHTNLGNALEEKGLLDEAIAEHRKAIRIKEGAGFHNNLGSALFAKRQLDEAIAAFRDAIHIKEDCAEAHCNLGLALQHKGQFRESIEELRRGHELGSRNPSWPWPSAQLFRQAQELANLDDRLSAILEGKDQPKNAAERLSFAKLCQKPHRQQHAAAARFYEQAFDAEPNLAEDVRARHRYNAACAAALAGCGQDKDADKLDAKERASLRQKALDWLRADLDAWGLMLRKEPDNARPVVVEKMRHWQADADFSGVRGAEALSKLPEAERQLWEKLWDDVGNMVARAHGKTTPQKKSGAK
jgi:serine/threonine protein kinase/Tfp pilus assembly protein PilF